MTVPQRSTAAGRRAGRRPRQRPVRRRRLVDRAPGGCAGQSTRLRRPSRDEEERPRATSSATASERRAAGAPARAPPDQARATSPSSSAAHAPADAAGDLDQRRAEDQVAVVAREPGLGHDRDQDPPGEPEQRQRRRSPPARCSRGRLRAASPARARVAPRQSAKPATITRRTAAALIRQQHRRPGVVDQLGAERALGERGAVGARVLGAADAAEEVARAPVLGQEPQHRDQREQRRSPACAPPGPSTTATARRSPRRARSRAGRARRRSRPRTPGAAAPSRWRSTAIEHDRRHQALGVAERVVGDEAAGEDAARPRRRRRPAGPAPQRDEPSLDRLRSPARSDRAGKPHSRAEDHRHRHQRARPRDHQPQVRRAPPNRANSVVKITGSGFHVGPPVVWRLRWTISRPHTSHAHGS